MIRRLSEEVQAKLRSGVAIVSLQQCVEELVLNSIDSGATCIAVRMNLDTCKVHVIDNGFGMERDQMEHMGTRYFTSKCHAVEDLENLRFYGFRGEALASISVFTKLLEVSSRSKTSGKTFVKVFCQGKDPNVFEAETNRPSPGTTVVVSNFFHNMPVRQKRMDPVLEAERIRQRVEDISLMHPSISFSLKNDCTGAMMVQLSKASDTYYRFAQIHGKGRAEMLGEFSFSLSPFELSGYIGREGHYNRKIQYLFVNNRFVLRTRIHKLLSVLLKGSSSSVSPAFGSPKLKKGADLQGVYVINIKCPYSEYDVSLEPAKTLIEFKDWAGLLLCIEKGVKQFLTKENMITKHSPEVIHTDVLGDPMEELVSSDVAVLRGFDPCNTRECYDGKTLASKTVYRKIGTEQVSQPEQDSNSIDDRQIGLTRTEKSCGMVQIEKVDASITCEQAKLSLEINADEYQSTQNDALYPGKELNPHIPPAGDASSPALVGGKDYTVGMSPCAHEKPELREQTSAVSDVTCCGNVLNNPGQKMLDVSVVGFIKHVVPRSEAEVPKITETLGDGEFCPPGPISAWHFISKECEALKESTLGLDSSTQSSHFEKLSKVLNTKVAGRLPGVPKRKLSLVDNSTHSNIWDGGLVYKTIPRPKLTLSVQVGSLDRFRRVYGKQPERVPAGVNLFQTGLYTDKSEISGKGSLSHTDTPYQTLCSKRKSSGSCLAAKLSHLKKQKRDSEGETQKQTLIGFKNMEECKEDGNCKEQTATPDASCLNIVPDANANFIDSSVGNVCDTVEATDYTDIKSRQVWDHLVTCAKNPHFPVSSAVETFTSFKIVDRQEHGSDEGVTGGNVDSSDWVEYFDNSVGKLVYINRVTGLSKYVGPSLKENLVSCTKDVTTMAVNVISKKGHEYRCYPFKPELVLPFLPIPRAERILRLENTDEFIANSLSTLLSEWTNPVFVRPPEVAMDVTGEQADKLVVKIHNILYPYRFTKDMVHTMKVVQQVDKKFLACLINTRKQEDPESSDTKGNLLVLVDQHAAHERVRLESLVADSYEEDSDEPGQERLRSSTVVPPLEIILPMEELRLLRSCQPFLGSLGLELEFVEKGTPRVFVSKVPVCFVVREASERRHGRQTVTKNIVEEYIRDQIELLQCTGRARSTLPMTVQKVLASQACHGAIKFNHTLSKEECCSLIGSLSTCQLPFQCAHGRPSMIPIADLRHIDTDQQVLQKPNLRKLRRLYRAWELFGNK